MPELNVFRTLGRLRGAIAEIAIVLRVGVGYKLNSTRIHGYRLRE
jgi:hypothetical protein